MIAQTTQTLKAQKIDEDSLFSGGWIEENENFDHHSVYKLFRKLEVINKRYVSKVKENIIKKVFY